MALSNAATLNPFLPEGTDAPAMKGPDLMAQAKAGLAREAEVQAAAEREAQAAIEAERAAAAQAAQRAAERTAAERTPTVEPTTTSVAVAQNTAIVAAPAAPAFESAKLSGLENAIAALAGVAPGTFPRITAGLDGFSENKDKLLGKWIDIDIVSWNRLTVLTHGLPSATAEQNRLMRVSVDHKHVKGGDGLTNDEYIQTLKTVHGLDGACSKEYVEVYGAVVNSAEKGPVGEDDQALAQVSLSPQSVAKWTGFLATLMWKKSQGRSADRVRVRMSTSTKVNGAMRWAVVDYKLVD